MKLRIIEEFWGVNRRSGARSTGQTDEKVFEPIIGNAIEMPTGRRRFTVDAADENSVMVTVHYENNPSANKTWRISLGESINYRPASRDGGYKYTLSYED